MTKHVVEIDAKDTEDRSAAEKNVANKVHVDDSEAASPDEKHEKKKFCARLPPVVNNDLAAVEVFSSTPADELAAKPSGRRTCEVACEKGESRS